MSIQRKLDGVIGENQRVNELAFRELSSRLSAFERLARGLVELRDPGVVVPNLRLRFLDLRLHLVDPLLRRGAAFRNLLPDVALGSAPREADDSEKQCPARDPGNPFSVTHAVPPLKLSSTRGHRGRGLRQLTRKRKRCASSIPAASPDHPR